MNRSLPTLYIFCGLPGAGKSTLAKLLARHLGGAYLRIDAIETGLRTSALAPPDVMDAGYAVARSLTAENLALGGSVIADAVHWTEALRQPWVAIAEAEGAAVRWIEVLCNDDGLRRSRIELRTGRRGWGEVGALRMTPVTAPDVRIETSTATVKESLTALISALDALPLSSGRPE